MRWTTSVEIKFHSGINRQKANPHVPSGIHINEFIFKLPILYLHVGCKWKADVLHISPSSSLLSDAGQACLQSFAVSRGRTYSDGLDHVRRMEVWAGKSNPALEHLIIPAPQQSESLPPVQLTCGVWCRPCLTLWLVVAACQCSLWAGPEVRVFPDCVSRGEGGGVKPNSPRPQWRGVSNDPPSSH